MSTGHSRSWEDVTGTLRRAAAEVRSALGRAGDPAPDDAAEVARLKGDVSQLEQTAGELVSTLSAQVRDWRTEIGSSLDRERAQRSANQVKTSLEDLADLAVGVSADIGSAANSTLKQVEPDLRKVALALERVAESASSWLRSTIDPAKTPAGDVSENRPPLDDL